MFNYFTMPPHTKELSNSFVFCEPEQIRPLSLSGLSLRRWVMMDLQASSSNPIPFPVLISFPSIPWTSGSCDPLLCPQISSPYQTTLLRAFSQANLEEPIAINSGVNASRRYYPPTPIHDMTTTTKKTKGNNEWVSVTGATLVTKHV